MDRYELFNKLSLPRIPVTINEYGNYWHSVPGYPGAHVSWIANLERNNVTSAMHACWHETPYDSCDTCSNASLNGLLTCEDRPRPRSHWHAYKAYGDMRGRFVVTDQRLAGDLRDVDGLMALDCNRSQAVVLVGYYPAAAVGPRAHQRTTGATPPVARSNGDCVGCLGVGNASSANITLVLRDLPACLVKPAESDGGGGGALRVLVERITFSGAAALEATMIVLNRRISGLVAGGSMDLVFELGPMDAAQITLSGL